MTNCRSTEYYPKCDRAQDSYERARGREKKLNERLREAEKVIEFYGDKNSYEPDGEVLCSLIGYDIDFEMNKIKRNNISDSTWWGVGGRNAREYLRKYAKI